MIQIVSNPMIRAKICLKTNLFVVCEGRVASYQSVQQHAARPHIYLYTVP